MPTTTNFAFTGAQQSLTIPAGVESATLEVWGASGRDYNVTEIGGKGGYVKVITLVQPGDIFYIYVGGMPQSSYGVGYNGGGIGASNIYPGYSAGGATDIRRGGITLADRVLIGGGGGGAARSGSGASGGYPWGQSSPSVSGGRQDGPGPDLINNATYPCIFGTLGQGANTPGSGTRHCGAGGGGKWGGNSMGGGFNYSQGGGGGSSYYDLAYTVDTAEASGTWVGNGKAAITLPDPINIATATLGPLTAIAEGATAFYPRYIPERHLLWVMNHKGERVMIVD